MKSQKTSFLKVFGGLAMIGLVLGSALVPFSKAKAEVVLASVAITASPSSICFGQSAQLNWSSTDATSVSINQGVGSVSPYGNTTVSPVQTTTYTITGTNSTGGHASASATVTVSNGSSCGDYQTPYPTPCNDCGGNDDDEKPEVTTRSADDIKETSATLNGRVDGNGSSTQVWFEWSTDRDDLDEETDDQSTGSGTDSFDDRITGLRRDTTYYFRAIAENDEGTDRGSILSFRTDDNDGDDDDDDNDGDLTAVTTPATNITGSTAILNSLILTDGEHSTRTWFEWGPSTNLGSKTAEISIGTQDSIRESRTITGLVSGVTYYFRAVAENSQDTNKGAILSFRTNNGVIIIDNPPVIRNTTTVINRGGGSTNSLVMLTIEDGSQFITNGENRQYDVRWENISGRTLHDVVVRVLLPHSMSFQTSDKGTFSNIDRTLTYNIDTLRSGDTGHLVFLANSGLTLEDGELVVVVATLVYTDSSNVQGDSIAYYTHTAYTGGSVLGANAFFAGFFPVSLCGWLLLLVFILLLILLVKYLTDSRRTVTVVNGHPNDVHHI